VESSPNFDGDAEDAAAHGQTDDGDRLDDDEFVDCTPPGSANDADADDFGGDDTARGVWISHEDLERYQHAECALVVHELVRTASLM
jgi:hypothetical protein